MPTKDELEKALAAAEQRVQELDFALSQEKEHVAALEKTLASNDEEIGRLNGLLDGSRERIDADAEKIGELEGKVELLGDELKLAREKLGARRQGAAKAGAARRVVITEGMHVIHSDTGNRGKVETIEGGFAGVRIVGKIRDPQNPNKLTDLFTCPTSELSEVKEERAV